MKEVNQIMESYVGIVRSNTRLTRAWNRLDILYEETEKLFKSSKATRELCELRNMINVGYLITRQAHGTQGKPRPALYDRLSARSKITVMAHLNEYLDFVGTFSFG